MCYVISRSYHSNMNSVESLLQYGFVERGLDNPNDYVQVQLVNFPSVDQVTSALLNDSSSVTASTPPVSDGSSDDEEASAHAARRLAVQAFAAGMEANFSVFRDGRLSEVRLV